MYTVLYFLTDVTGPNIIKELSYSLFSMTPSGVTTVLIHMNLNHLWLLKSPLSMTLL